MKAGDKELFFWLGGGIVLLLLLAWLFGRQQAAANTVPPGSGIPGLGSPYSWTVPGFPPPLSITGGTYNINQPNPSFAWLSPYFPLFGFVGAATTQIYQ